MTARCPHNDSDRVICHACYRAGVRPNLPQRPEPPRRPARDLLVFVSVLIVSGAFWLAVGWLGDVTGLSCDPAVNRCEQSQLTP
jgi:hypothetical protein